MDFYRINERTGKDDSVEIYPDFKVVRSSDLMLRSKDFYAIWDEEKGLWSTDEYDVQRLVDADLLAYKKSIESRVEGTVKVRYMGNFSSGIWRDFQSYMKLLSDSSHQLDANLTFSNTEVKKTDYVSRRLPYPLSEGDYSAWDEIIGTLYDPAERAKLEWAIGAIVSGDAKHIQKFLVLYGPPGSGKGTILNIVLKMFVGYTTTFEAKALTSGNNQFAMDVFSTNPLVGVQHDGDMSRIEDNSKFNSITSHEDMTINEKFKPSHTSSINAFLFMGTNKPVKITDAKSGIIRRLIDVQPSGEKLAPRRYQALMSQIDFELGAIAYHCLEVYREMGRDFYEGYRAIEMMLQTDVFYNYIEQYYDIFYNQDGTTLNQAYELYKEYVIDAGLEYKVNKPKFREELRNYFDSFEERTVIDGVRVRSWYSGFLTDKFKVHIKEEPMVSLVMDEHESLFDELCANQPAQYSKGNGSPTRYWTNKPVMRNGELVTPPKEQVVDTVLSDLDTTQEHYVRPPENHIVIDFDLKDANGEKSAELNLEAASKWPPTYSEYSKSGGGIHLHYNYAGDSSELGRVYSDGIEVKVFTGESSLRRRLSKCNNVPVATLNSGLPLKEKKVLNTEHVKSERGLRDLIQRNLRKEIHPGTKPSIDFITKILNDAYSENVPYDLTDMRSKVLAFANGSSNQALYCIKQVQGMKFKSADVAVDHPAPGDPEFLDDDRKEVVPNRGNGGLVPKDERLAFFDVEVFPNFFCISWKFEGDSNVVRMMNPDAKAVEELFSLKLVGYNCRRYDNHILYARFLGYNNEQLYKLSQKIISGTPGALFGEAYDLSYVDIYDYTSKKQSLKKYQIELGLVHKELGLPWDEPVPEELWDKVMEYCDNDVISTEQTHEARKQDFVARQILADLSGLPVNASTQQHTAKIIFEGNRRPQTEFVYTDLSKDFPGYTFDGGKSTYKGEVTGEGGYVYAEPGMYENVALLDVASMHPTSIEVLDLFGPYTKNFSALKAARMAIKHEDYDSAKQMLGGLLARHLQTTEDAEALSYALKIVINIVYGLTSARFDNPFKDPRNKDNIVAKRGALFMIDLKEFVQGLGYTVAHIKTDSIKIPGATKEIIDLVMEFGESYGYTFEHEATYEKFCLVNEAVYVAYVKAGRKPAHWEAVGAQFQHPYVFKTLFSHEPIEFRDLCEAKFVTTSLYLDFTNVDEAMALTDEKIHFVGKAGLFCPIKPDRGGAVLLREKDGKFHAATGTRGYTWLEAEMVQALGKQDDIDESYFKKLVDAAVDNISKHGDFEQFRG